MKMNKAPLVVDIETSDLSGSEIWCVGFANEQDAWCVEWDADSTPAYLDELQTTHILVFHNAKFDVRHLRSHGCNIEPGYRDTMVMAYAWNPRREEGYGLESLGEEVGVHKDTENGVSKDWRWHEDTKKRIMDYCMQDCRVTYALYIHYLRLLETDSKALKHLLEIELPFIDALIEMESTGFYIDVEGSDRMVCELEAEMDALMVQICSMVPLVPGKEVNYKGGSKKTRVGETVTELPEDEKYFKRYGRVRTKVTPIYEYTYDFCVLEEFNPNSSRHLIYALQTLYKWEPTVFTKSGQASTSAEVLSDLGYPMAELFTQHAELAKAYGMVKGYRERLDGRRLFGNFNQVVTKTGRLSSSDPNLQNIPTNGKWGEKMRSLFVSPGDGWAMVGCDLSNIEGRVLAHLLAKYKGEERLAETFRSGVDFHQANADAWGLSRKEAKTGLYALLYGAGATKVGGGDKVKGQAILDSIYAGMPAIKELKEAVWESCRKRDGVIHDEFGRRLCYPEINLSYAVRKTHGDKREAKKLMAQAERRVFNALLQGTAASALKVMVNDMLKRQAYYSAYLVANVHDEAIYYVPDDDVEDFMGTLDEVFKQPLLSHCPVMGEPKKGNSWHDTH